MLSRASLVDGCNPHSANTIESFFLRCQFWLNKRQYVVEIHSNSVQLLIISFFFSSSFCIASSCSLIIFSSLSSIHYRNHQDAYFVTLSNPPVRHLPPMTSNTLHHRLLLPRSRHHRPLPRQMYVMATPEKQEDCSAQFPEVKQAVV